MGSTWLNTRATQNVMVVARLRRGATREPRPRRRSRAAVAQLSQEHPRNGHLQLRLTRPGCSATRSARRSRAFAWGLFGLGVLLMLAGCSNLAGLLLARGNDRTREIVLRTALGAGKMRIARQLLTESMLLAACGGVGGAAIAWAGTRAVSAWRLPTELPVQLDVTADLTRPALRDRRRRSLVGTASSGVAPARFASRLDLNRSLKSNAGFAIGGRRLQGREILVCLQVAFCVVLLHASFLAVRGLQRAATASLGWNPDGLVMAATELGLARYKRPNRSRPTWRRIVEEARALPGVVSATTSNSMPLHIDQSSTTLFTLCRRRSPDARLSRVLLQRVAGLLRDAADSLPRGPRLHRVRYATSRRWWRSSTAPLAERLFGGQTPSANRFASGRGGAPIADRRGRRRREIHRASARQRRAAIFCPLTQRYTTSSMLIVRSSPIRRVTAEDLRRVIHRIDPSLPIRIVGHRRANHGAAAAALPRRGGRARPARTDRQRPVAVGSARDARLRRGRSASARSASASPSAPIARRWCGPCCRACSWILSIGVALGALLSSGTGPMVSSMVLGVSPAEPLLVAAIVGMLALIALVVVRRTDSPIAARRSARWRLRED